MTKLVINIGTQNNDGTGDPLRTAFNKVNSNFTEVYSFLSEKAVYPSQVNRAGKYLRTDGANVTFEGIDYNDVTNKPSIPSAQVNTDWNATTGISAILNRPSLSLVATTGRYADLVDAPPAFSGSYNDLTNKPFIFSGNYNDLSNKPTFTTSQLINGSHAVSLDTDGNVSLSGSLNNVTAIQFADSTSQSSASISITDLKTLVAASTDFADFQSRIAAL